MASPAKNMKTGSYSHSFEMKAKNYNNSPIDKNYGSAESRFPSSSAVPFSSSLGGVGESPAKGWLSNIAKKLNPINAIKKLTGLGKGGGGLLGLAKDKLGLGGGGEVQPHGDEMHTGGTATGGVGEAVAGVGAGMPPDKTNIAAAAMAAGTAATTAGGQSAGGNKWDMLKASGASATAGAEEEVV